MERIALEARNRALRKKHTRFLRRAGITPANLYGAGMGSIALQVETKNLVQTIAHTSRNTPISLQIVGEERPRAAFIWNIQRDPLTEEILHVDFYFVEATRTMRARVPLVLENVDTTLEKQDLRVAQLTDSIEVETLPADLPTEVRVDASALREMGQEIRVKALVIGERVKVLTDPEFVVAKVSGITEMEEEEVKVPESAEVPVAGEEGAEGEEAAQEEGKEGPKAKKEAAEEGEKKEKKDRKE